MTKNKFNSFKHPIEDHQWVNALFQRNPSLDRLKANNVEMKRIKESVWEDIGYTRKGK